MERSFFILFTLLTFNLTFSATLTWDGGGADSNFSTSDNWVSSSPANDDNLIFSGNTRLTPNNDNLTSITDLTFNSGSGAFTLGGNALTLKGDISHSDDSTQTISSNITLDTGTRTFNVNSTGDLSISGVIDGAGALTKSGNGTLILSGSNSYSGNTIVSNGILDVHDSDAISDTTVSSGATLQFSGGSNLTFASENVSISGTGEGGIGALNHTSGNSVTFNNALTLAGNSTVRIDTGTFWHSIRPNGGITDGGSNYTLTKTGGSRLRLSVSSSGWEGDLVHSEGYVMVIHNESLGGSAGTTTVQSGAVLEIAKTGGSLSIAENIGIAGDGLLGKGAIYNLDYTGDNTNIFSGNITLNADASVNIEGANDGLHFSNTISDGGSGYVFTKNGAGILLLSGNNTYTGNTVISNGTLQLTGSIDGGLVINNTSSTVEGLTIANAVAGALNLSAGTLSPNSTASNGKANFTGTGSHSITGGTYVWNVSGGLGDSGTDTDMNGYNEVSGSADGSHYDILSFSGALDFSGASTDSIVIQLTSSGSTGWGFGKREVKIMEATSILNFNESYFNLDTSSFDHGDPWWTNWRIASHSNALWLQYEAVPEPGTWISIMTLLAILVFRSIRIMNKKNESKDIA